MNNISELLAKRLDFLECQEIFLGFATGMVLSLAEQGYVTKEDARSQLMDIRRQLISVKGIDCVEEMTQLNSFLEELK